jgi:hypothetical protein
MAYLGRQPLAGEVILMNSIESQFNGVLTTFNLTRTVSGSTLSFFPVSSEHLFVSLGGVIQQPDNTGNIGFRINYDQIIFAVAPPAGTKCFIIAYGNVLDIGTPADGTVTPDKLSTGGPWWLTNGNFGIGTTNPGYLLELSRYGNAEIVLKNTRNTSGGPCDSSFSSLDQYAEIGTITQHPLRLKTGNTPKLTINTDGHVIIGATTASSWSSPSKALEIASTSNNVTYKNSLFSYGDNFHITNNSYYDNAWKYVNDGFSGALSLSPTSLIYRTAVSGLADGSITWVNKFVVDSSGNVGIGVSGTIGYKLEVNGSFAATTKSFIIPHPSKENYKLRYACLEGPENSVYVRGRTKDNVIELPDYWVDLVHEESITVNLTPIGNKRIWIEEINNNKVYINSEDTIDCFYTVFAERKDVEQLVVEIEEN